MKNMAEQLAKTETFWCNWFTTIFNALLKL